MRIAVDFDGTIVEHKYPSIGKERPFAVETLKQLSDDGHKLILWTVRSGDTLDEAVKWCAERGLVFYAVNSNQPAGALFSARAGESPKIEADIFIDDSNIGGLPDWGKIYEIIEKKTLARKKRRGRKKHWWKRLLGK